MHNDPITIETASRAPHVVGTASTSVDWSTGIIKTVGRGFWSAEQINAHFDAFNRTMSELRRTIPFIIVISDLREMAPQSQDVIAVINARSQKAYELGDRIALIVPSSLVKMQMRRALPANHEFFLSMNAAEKWAMAHRMSEQRVIASVS